MYHLAHKLEQQKDSQGNLDRTDFYLNVGNLCEPRNGMREREEEREKLAGIGGFGVRIIWGEVVRLN